MPYIKETCVAGNTIEVNKYFCYRVHTKGEKRAKKEKLTPEAQKKVNQRKAAKELRRLMNENFRDGDSLVRLDFFEKPGSSLEMQDIMEKMTRKLRAEYRKQGRELKYIYVKEVGPRGGRHIHMMMNKVDTDTLRKVWPYGGIHVDPLISNGQYRKVAEYFIKYAGKTEQTEGKLIGKRWYASRNLVRPVPEKMIIPAATFRRTVKEQPGYYLEKESLQYGISEYTGFAYFSYTLIKAAKEERRGMPMDRVNLYLYTTPKGPRKRPGAYTYILEMETVMGPATLSRTERLGEATNNQAELLALAAALRRLKKPCALSIYTDCAYLAAALEKDWLEAWRKKGWLNAKGKPVANREEWQEVADLLNVHSFQFRVGEKHSYYSWMERETKKEEERCTNDLENLT